MQTLNSKDEDWFEKERLHFAAEEGDLVKVKGLLKQGYPINAFDEFSRTPLHYAAIEGHTAVVRYLIEAGADVNLHEEEKIGDTVLKEIAQTCSIEMATILIEAGADPTIPGWMGLTALDESKERKKPWGQQVHKLLCETAKKCNPRWPRLKHFLKSKKSTH
jgi:Ankyrin repeats (3 copies)